MPSNIYDPVKTYSAPLPKPGSLKLALPLDKLSKRNVERSRDAIRGLMSHQVSDDRLMVVVGPCSIHDTNAALDYASLLARAAERHQHELVIVMRVYIEKPRSTVGWKGLIHHPDYAQDFGYSPHSTVHDLCKGVSTARKIMLDVAKKGLPVATELLNPLLAYFFDDIVSLGVIGARTTESQTHREMASDMPMPMGMKNGTDGGIKVAIDAMKAVSRSHTVVGVDENASLAYHMSRGNPDTFVILRGGSKGPNFSSEHIQAAEEELLRAGEKPSIVVDCSHGNSSKDYRNQGAVAACLADQIAVGAHIMGVMIESNINEGRQDVPDKGSKECLKYGVSITDGCVGWHETELILERLAAAVRQRQEASATSSPRGEPIPKVVIEQPLDNEKRPVKEHAVKAFV